MKLGGLRLGIVGVTGMVGRNMLSFIEERNINYRELRVLASHKSVGKKYYVRGQKHQVKEAVIENLKGLDVILFATGTGISKELVPKAREMGAICIDNSSYFRLDSQVPLIVPEVNPEQITNHQGIIANPNCSTIQLLVPLKPLHDAYQLTRIVFSTYQAVSGSGRGGITELSRNSALKLTGLYGDNNQYPREIAFNCLPQVDDFTQNGYTKEEMKMINETHKILANDIKVTGTCVRVPVYNGHAESVTLEFEKPISTGSAKQILQNKTSVKLIDQPENLAYPLQINASGKDSVFVGRIRKDETVNSGLHLWIVADNLRKGAATNAVQILELLLS